MIARSDDPRDWGLKVAQPAGPEWIELSQEAVPRVVRILFGDEYMSPIMSREQIREEMASGFPRDRGLELAKYLMRRQFRRGRVPTRFHRAGEEWSLWPAFWSLKPEGSDGKPYRSLMAFDRDPHGRPKQPMYLVDPVALDAWLVSLALNVIQTNSNDAERKTDQKNDLRGKHLEKALDEWVHREWGPTFADLPGRCELLSLARDQVSPNVSDGHVRKLRRDYATADAKKGGAKYHRDR